MDGVPRAQHLGRQDLLSAAGPRDPAGNTRGRARHRRVSWPASARRPRPTCTRRRRPRLQAQREWAALPYDERAAVLRRAGDAVRRARGRDQRLADPGVRRDPPVRRLPGGIAPRSATRPRRWPATRTASCCAPNQPRLSFARRLPVGVVGVIAPFNVPTILAIRAVAPALALGNAVILKPDPRTAICGGVVFARIFEEAGLPAGRAAGAARRRRRRRGAGDDPPSG